MKHYYIEPGRRMKLPPGTVLANQQDGDDGLPVFLYRNQRLKYDWVMTQEEDGGWRVIEYGPDEPCDCDM